MEKYCDKWECCMTCHDMNCGSCDIVGDCEFCRNEDTEMCLNCKRYYEDELKGAGNGECLFQ